MVFLIKFDDMVGDRAKRSWAAAAKVEFAVLEGLAEYLSTSEFSREQGQNVDGLKARKVFEDWAGAGMRREIGFVSDENDAGFGASRGYESGGVMNR